MTGVLPRCLLALVASSISGCATIGEVVPPPCGGFELRNSIMAQAGESPDERRSLILEPPYAAAMGERTRGQIADLSFVPSGWGAEDLLFQQRGPASMEYSVLAADWRRLGAVSFRIGTPGEYVVSFTGEESGCRTEFPLTVVVDEVLREFDARQGLTEPPPPDSRDRTQP